MNLFGRKARSCQPRKRSRNFRVESLEPRLVLDSTVVFNEVMYNPLGDTDDSLEFVEFFNQLTVDIDVSNWTIEGGIDFTFPQGTIVPGRGYAVVAADPAALQAESGFAGALGPFSGRLDNDGETLRIFDIDGRRMNEFEYDDHGDFSVGPDGGGPSLAKIDAFGASEEKLNWDVSSTLGGTPGAANTTGSSGSLAINEVPSSLDDDFWVEIVNLGATSVNLAGNVLATTLVANGELGAQYAFPSQSLAAGQTFVVTEAELGFSVTASEKLFLFSPGLNGLLDGQIMTEQLRGRSEERGGRWLYPDVETPGAANSFAFHDDIVINEIMYAHRPFLPSAPGEVFADSNEEWIELYNRGATPVDLGGWTFEDAMQFTFAPGTIINPGEYLVVSNDAAALLAQYPGVNIVGDFSRSLSNHDDWIRLFDAVGNPADDVHYYDGGSWPALADAGGSSLELRDVDADNSKGEAWAASDEASKSSWTTFSFTANGSEPLNCCTTRNEFIFGLLDSGEFLIDDISVRNSGGQEIIQNGDFQSDAVGGLPSSWQQIGNHDTGRIALDPDDPTNRVLHVEAQGPQAHVHDHVKTTVIGGLNNGNYQFSFRARWLGGSRKINTRLFFTRASHTSVMDAPLLNGTPGAANSTAQANVGPTYDGMVHGPVSPNAGQAVNVSIQIDDPDGVATARLWYSVNGGAWASTVMSAAAGNLYAGTIPGQSSNQVVQFYVEGTDGLGATSTFPRDGRDSRALYQVNAGVQNAPVDTVRVIMLGGDHSALFANQMSNDTFGGTFVRNNTEVFYDVDVRQIGSRYIRPNSGYKIAFNPDQLYFGVHDSIRMDVDLIDEYLYTQLISAAGGSETSFYVDVVHSFSPQYGSRRIVLNLARYENMYLDELFENGSDGTKFELDDITYPNPGGGGNSTGVSPQDMFYRGDSPEFFRGQLLIKSNREKDDYLPLVEFTRVLHNGDGLASDAWNEQLDTVMDVDLWMRHYATQAYLGNWDTYGFSRPKNLRIYTRPEDGKIIPFYWDADRANLTDSLIYNGGQTRLDEIRNIPANTRLFWGHMWDLMNRTFNPEYAAHWRTNFSALGVSTRDLTARTNQARAQAISTIPTIAYNVTSPNATVNDVIATISGDGWIDVREIRLAGNNDPLPIRWTDNNSWQVTVPVAFGPNALTLEAYDYEGNLIGSDTITITSTIESRPLRDSLRITEIHYNPLESGDATEFIELMNIAAPGSPTLNISAAKFTNGIAFDFGTASITTMAAGDRIVLVRDLAAFQAMYGMDVPVAGVYVDSALNNGGEGITLVDENDIPIHDFSYNDNWYPSTDGGGFSLTVVDPLGDLNAWDTAAGWRPSEHLGGSPGADDGGVIPGSIVVNEIVANGTGVDGDWVELLNRSDDPIDLSHWYLSDDEFVAQKYQFPVGTTIAANGFLLLTQTADFGNAGNPASLIQFELNELGGGIYLRSGDDQSMVTGYLASTAVDGSEPDASFGRYATSDGFDVTELQSATPAAANALPVFGPVIVNELMYNPSAGGVEFIELRNTSASSIDLTGWSFINGIDYTFAAGATIAAGGYTVLIEGADGGDAAAEAAAFRAANGVPASVDIHVYTQAVNGVLDNAGEKLELARPGALVAAPVVVDWARYNDRAPWPTLPDGDGPSLARADANAYTNDPTTWATGNNGGTPGKVNRFFDATPPTDPTNLVGRVGNTSLAELAWASSADPETGIGHYVVYRDNVAVGTTPIPRFSDTSSFGGGSTVTYEVSAVNGDGAESGRISVAIDIGTLTISFQDGVSGYTGARDAEIREGTPDANNGLTDQGLEVDGEDGGTELSVLLQWNNVALPAGATLAGASITVTSFNPGHQYEFYRLLRGWEEGQVTWNSARTGQPWASPGARAATDRGATIGIFDGQTGVNTTDLNAAGVAMVQAWLDDPTNNNFGVIMADPGPATDGADLRSREFGTATDRPKLNLSYVAPADPPVPGDLDLNDQVDLADAALMSAALAAGVQSTVFDLDGSGFVDADDLTFLLVEYLGQPAAAVLVNEVVSHGEGAQGDWIELKNVSDDPVDVGNWFVSDDEFDSQKYRIPAGTTIPANGFLVLTQTDHFGNAGNADSLIQFELNEQGGAVHLRTTDIHTTASFGATEPNGSFGRYERGIGFDFTALQTPTPGAENALPAFGPVILNEVMYDSDDQTPPDVEFVELYNTTPTAMALNDGAGNAWQFSSGIQFTFPAGAAIPGNGYAVLLKGADGGDAAAEAAAFRIARSVPANVQIHVYTAALHGDLDDAGEVLELTRPGNQVNGQVVVDWMRYDDRDPWPTAAAGTGPSLARADATGYTNDAATWTTGNTGGTPGKMNRPQDLSPPTNPTNLVGRLGAGNVGELAWTASTDAESGIGHYRVYRNDQFVGTTPIARFTGTIPIATGQPASYEISAVNSDGVEGARNSTPLVINAESTTVVSFQQGVGGYSGAFDSEIRQSAADIALGNANLIQIDGVGGPDRSAVLKWTGLAIPAGAAVASASITLTVTNGGHVFDIHRLARDWDESTVTWNSAQSGQPWQTAGALGASDRGVAVGALSGTFGGNTTDLNPDGVAMVQAWLDDPASNNFGVVISGPAASTDAVFFHTSESTNAADHPRLDIHYSTGGTNAVPGDLDLNDVVDAADVSLMEEALAAGVQDSTFDLNGDSQVNAGDLSHLVVVHLGSAVGDANLDGRVDRADVAIVAGNFGSNGTGRWSLGDFNGDSKVDLADAALVQMALGFDAQGSASAPSPPLSPIAQAADVVLRSASSSLTRRDAGGNVATAKRRMVVAAARPTPRLRWVNVDVQADRQAPRAVRSPRVATDASVHDRRDRLLADF